MIGEIFSKSNSGRIYRDTTIIQCDGFIFEFKQVDISHKQHEYINRTELTTIVTIKNIRTDQLEKILDIIDDLCWLLSFIQQSPIRRHGYKLNSNQEWTSCLGIVINPLNNIIENSGKETRKFIEQTYPNFKKLKSARQLTVVFGYISEANISALALEAKLILHYVLIENLKHTFANIKAFKKHNTQFSHPSFPDLENKPEDIADYEVITQKTKKNRYRHKKYGKCGSNEMIKRTFEDVGISRNITNDIIDKRNKMIHEGILLPFGDINYSKQAIEDLQDVSDLLRKYLLTILNYKGSYYLSRDRIGCSGLIT